MLTDIYNPVPHLRARPVVGIKVIQDLEYDRGIWKNGKGYSPEEGKHFSCKTWLTKDGRLKVRGYWGVFYRTETWTKVKKP